MEYNINSDNSVITDQLGSIYTLYPQRIFALELTKVDEPTSSTAYPTLYGIVKSAEDNQTWLL